MCMYVTRVYSVFINLYLSYANRRYLSAPGHPVTLVKKPSSVLRIIPPIEMQLRRNRHKCDYIVGRRLQIGSMRFKPLPRIGTDTPLLFAHSTLVSSGSLACLVAAPR